MPNLCVSCTFNPPVITVLGAQMKDETLHLLEKKLPQLSSTSINAKSELSKFNFFNNPDHWRLTMSQHFCDELHKSQFFSTITECLLQDGWLLRASNSVSTAADDTETVKLFFTR
ncbi:hypothetical protein STCU_00342 [Strigomonas culicis]|uniref:Uncharacterized protein n=1 Tax=Strigomonas culicis TaxID=28005 RepID=S9VLV9_9TRYP|nr:hypothetical protein STCU_05303 [Strigomonas culicis]EPY36267.1 hypothetical protein STCU_00671 [Strigomonas culicis]EPY36917.1 hypothetical protein STCU_00342 [Strigomonas culicis]|eukprot:EPY28096.1 hypothetical protein STCU_05303 [Strigomonas culicis]